MKKHILRSLTLALAVLLTLSAALPLTSCSKPPELDEIRDRVISLIESSYELNEIFWGKGLPTYPRVEDITDKPLEYSSEHDKYYLLFEDGGKNYCMYYESGDYKFLLITDEPQAGVEAVFTDTDNSKYYYPTEYEKPKLEYSYSDDDYDEKYDVVRLDAKYTSVDDIKTAAAKVFSADYLKGIYSSAFDGVAYAEGASSGVRRARFTEYDGLLRQRNDIEPRISAKRLYDYSTMKIIKPSDEKRVNLRIDSHLEGSDEILNINLCVTLGADGAWYLDSPTY